MATAMEIRRMLHAHTLCNNLVHVTISELDCRQMKTALTFRSNRLQDVLLENP